MAKVAGLEHSNELFRKEQAEAAKNGIAVVWTAASKNDIKVYKQIAAALPGVRVRTYIKATEYGPQTGAKIVNQNSRDLSLFWTLAR